MNTAHNSVRGTLSDIPKYVNQFMDVAEEEGKTSHLMTDSGGVALGHDGAYTVEIPGWGIREKFGSAAEAKDYLNGRYKEYDNTHAGEYLGVPSCPRQLRRYRS